MPRTAQIVSILIASPGDVERQRDVIHGEVESWNRSALSRTLGVQLEALRWELDAIPELGTGDAQSVINRQLRDDADIVVGIFHTRIGTRTARAESGTAEEIENSAADGKPVHVYVDVSDVPINHDPEQLASLKRYVARLSTRGLLREVASDDELARHVRLALDRDVANLLAEGSRSVGSKFLTRMFRPRQYEPVRSSTAPQTTFSAWRRCEATRLWTDHPRLSRRCISAATMNYCTGSDRS